MKDRIKQIRKSFPKEGKTQKTFAEFLGIPQDNLASYETGRRTPTDAVVQLICEKCNVNKDWLENGTGEMKNASENDMEFADICFKIGVKDQKAKQAIINYWNLSESDRELFWKFIEQIVPSNTAEKEKTVEELENEYKKTVLNSVSETTSSALNTMPDTGLKNAMNK